MQTEHEVIRFTVQGETVTIRTSGTPQRLVYMHEIQDDGKAVWRQCRSLGCSNFALIAIQIPAQKWNDALTPWECAGLFADDAPFTGQATNQLMLLIDEIVPQSERLLGSTPYRSTASTERPTESENPEPGRILAGYSLAGLFAVWAAYNSTLFSRIASASGSLWYPGFDEYAETHPFARKPESAYFSLGSKEARTPSRLLRHVAEGTANVFGIFKQRNVEAVFEKNPGNHFKEPDLRMAKGIAWALEH